MPLPYHLDYRPYYPPDVTDRYLEHLTPQKNYPHPSFSLTHLIHIHITTDSSHSLTFTPSSSYPPRLSCFTHQQNCPIVHHFLPPQQLPTTPPPARTLTRDPFRSTSIPTSFAFQSVFSRPTTDTRAPILLDQDTLWQVANFLHNQPLLTRQVLERKQTKVSISTSIRAPATSIFIYPICQ